MSGGTRYVDPSNADQITGSAGLTSSSLIASS